MRTTKIAMAAAAIFALSSPALASAANFDVTNLAGVYSSTFTSGGADRAGAYVVDTAADSKAAQVRWIRANNASGKTTAWDGSSSRAYSAINTSNKVVELRSCKTDHNPFTTDICGAWVHNN